jgi:capsular polysaccharide biosynthesis protein
MTSSIQLKVQEQIRTQKKIDRAREAEEFAKAEAERIARKKANDERISRKMAIIAAGGIVPNPQPPVVEVEEKPVEKKEAKKVAKKVAKKPVEQKVAKKKVAKKKAAKKK